MITVSQAAADLGVSDRRVRALCAAGRIKATRIGRAWIILSLDFARNRPSGRPKSKDSKIIPIPEVVKSKGLTTTPLKSSKKSAKVATKTSPIAV